VADGVEEALDLAQHVHRGRLGQLTRIAGVGLGVEGLEHQLHAAHPVGDGVVDLHDQARPAVLEALDDRELPQRPGPVEGLHADGLGDVEQVSQAPTVGRAHEAEVVVEVEVGVDLPPRGREGQGVADDPLTEADDRAAGPLQLVPQARTVRGALQHDDGGDRAAEQRIPLDGPHELVGVAHAGLEVQVLVGHADQFSRWSPRCGSSR
jgi:hypothetical protein